MIYWNASVNIFLKIDCTGWVQMACYVLYLKTAVFLKVNSYKEESRGILKDETPYCRMGFHKLETTENTSSDNDECCAHSWYIHRCLHRRLSKWECSCWPRIDSLEKAPACYSLWGAFCSYLYPVQRFYQSTLEEKAMTRLPLKMEKGAVIQIRISHSSKLTDPLKGREQKWRKTR